MLDSGWLWQVSLSDYDNGRRERHLSVALYKVDAIGDCRIKKNQYGQQPD
jgi:hypothetical protein